MKIRAPRLLAPLLASFALAFGTFASAAPPQLLLPHHGAVEKSAKPKGFGSEGHRVKFNLPGLKSLKRGDAVELALPNGKRHTVHFDLLQDHGGGDVTFFGHIKDDKGHPQRVVITTGNAGSFGRIVTPEGNFQLVPGEGHDWLIDMLAEQEHLPIINLGKDYKVAPTLPKAGGLMFSPEYQELVPGVNQISVGAATPTPQVFVDIMFVYTPAFAGALGSGLGTRLNNLIANMNTYLADSEVAITLRLVHSVNLTTYTVDSTEDGGAALGRITPVNGGGTGIFANIESLRSQYGADMVMFLRGSSMNSGAGVAWIPGGPIGSSFAPYTYSVVTGCLSGNCDWVHMHELGHNMGINHDRHTATWENGGVAPVAPGDASHQYAFGFASCQGGTLSCTPAGGGCSGQPECSTSRSGTNNFADIMAYFHASTTRNLKFSNPNQSCSGSLGMNQACGIASGSTSADAARAMNENREALSGLRAAPAASVASNTVVAASQNPSNFGQSVTFTATVTGSAGTPTGTVNFRDNGASLAGCGAVALSATGRATCTTSSLAVGTHPITAVYSGNSTYVGSTSSTLSQGVAAVVATASISLVTSLNPSNDGQVVTFTATVSGSSGTPSGSVNFRTGSASIAGCAAVALQAGVARCTTTLATGIYSISAVYSGSSSYASASSGTLSQGVSQATNVALAASGATITASSDYGAPFSVLGAVIDGSRTGQTWGSGGGWEDNTYNAYPDFVEIRFNGWKQLDSVWLYSLRDDFGAASEPLDTATFTSYGVVDFNVQGWNGSSWVTLATVSANNMVKRRVDFVTFTTDRIRVNVTQGLYHKSRIVEIEAWGNPGTAPSTNVAAASAGATILASSNYGAPFSQLAGVIDGDRTATRWGSGGGWEDATYNSFPDWVEIRFNEAKAIDRVVVYTLRDDYGNPSEPTDATTFSLYGLVGFEVQGWNGSSWATLASVSGNNLVKRTVSFAAFATDRIRINVTQGLYFKSRIVEIEAFGTAAGSTPTNVAFAGTGATASVSSDYGAPHSLPAAIIDGDRSGARWGNGGGWEDATYNAYPDWAQINFNGSKTIDRVVVYTLRDDFGNPSDPSDGAVTTAYGISDFTVEGWTGSAWTPLAVVTNNNLVKRTVTFASFTTDRIRVSVGAARYFKSRIVEVEAYGFGPLSTNVALASAGASASASSDYGGSFSSLAGVIDGDRTATRWGSGGGWEDGTFDTYPDWLQVVFAGTRSIDRVVVYTLRDDYGNSAEPGDATTFSLYGLVDFQVQTWDGSGWVTQASVSGNNLVKRSVSFPAVSTDRVRINVTGSLYYKSRIVEVEAWGS